VNERFFMCSFDSDAITFGVFWLSAAGLSTFLFLLANEPQEQVIKLVCGETLETLITKTKRSCDSSIKQFVPSPALPCVFEPIGPTERPGKGYKETEPCEQPMSPNT
jgi:hypothetical protein